MTNKHDFDLPTIREILNNNNIKINKSLGQNFLFDINLTDKIVKRSLPIKSTVIEVGPGPGCLTRSILKQEPNIVFAIDKDVQSKKMLNDLKKIYNNKLEIIIDDALHYPIWNLGTAPRQIIANLPYNIGTKMLISWLKHINQFDIKSGLVNKKYSLTYYLSVGDQNCDEPGYLKLYEPDQKILPEEGTIVIIPASRSHSAIYNGKSDRVMIGINFYSI